MRWLLALVVVILVFALTYFRFAPVDTDLWHTAPAPKEIGDYPGERSFEVVRPITTTPEGFLEAIDRVAMATARTTRLAGSVEEGMVTYITRSAVFGFPDFTTVHVTEDNGFVLHVWARAKFGKLDMGVNKARVEDWLAQLGPLVAPAS